MEPSQLFPNLSEWLSTFHGCSHISSPKDVNDGIIIAKVLHQIEPLWFDSGWMEKINMDVGDNWRLKVRNLKKVSQAIKDYFSDGLEFSVGLLKQPDLNKLAEHGDVEEAARLLQLVLGVAINCSRKQEYIEAIQMLESSVQTALMAAIQELMSASSRSAAVGAGAAGDSLSVSSLLVNRAEQEQIVSELTQIREDRDALQQRCFELSRQLELLHNEKLAAHHENQHLQHRLGESSRDGRAAAAAVVGSSDSTAQLDDSASSDVGTGTGGAVLTSSGDRYKHLRVKLDAAEDEIYRLESSRDEFRNKCDLLSRELKDTQSKNEELQTLAEEARTLRDELDILRETSSKVSQYESTLGTYKKRLQEMGDLRRQITVLENKNTEYMQLNMELEEEVKKSGGYRPQLDIYKKQVAELHEQLAAETKKMDRAEFDVRKLNDKLTSVQCERDRVLEDRDRLKEAIDELRLTQLQQSSDAPGHGGPNSQLSGLDTLQQIPSDVRERLMRLQHENSVLRARCGDASQLSSGGQEQAYRALLDDVKQREASQQAENRRLNQRIIELESALEDQTHPGGATSTVNIGGGNGGRVYALEQELHSKTMHIGEMEIRMTEQASRSKDLQDQLSRREAEMTAMEERYKKYLEKAKSVIRTLDPKHSPAGAASPDVGLLRHQLAEKEKMIEMMEKDNEKSKSIREAEERLMSTAFYNIGMQVHRQAMEQRLSNVSGGQGSFMTRQRQANSRRLHGNSEFYDY